MLTPACADVHAVRSSLLHSVCTLHVWCLVQRRLNVSTLTAGVSLGLMFECTAVRDHQSGVLLLRAMNARGSSVLTLYGLLLADGAIYVARIRLRARLQRG